MILLYHYLVHAVINVIGIVIGAVVEEVIKLALMVNKSFLGIADIPM